MQRFSSLVTSVLLLVASISANFVSADEPTKRTAETPLAERLKAVPDDSVLLREFLGEKLRKAMGMLPADPDAADKQLADAMAVLKGLRPKTRASVQELARAKAAIAAYGKHVALARVTLEELEGRLVADPDDTDTLYRHDVKLTIEVNSLARTDAHAADAKLQSAREFLKSLRAKMTADAARRQLDQSEKGFARLERTVAAAKKLETLVGQDAMPLEVETWLNGSPLTDADLKGKVVLLDFWAVWCSPCIASFPHLREWDGQWADKGLVIIGLTRYYNFHWDEAAGRAVRGEGKVNSASECAMLKKFANNHDLSHRIAVQKTPFGMAAYYGVSGIPHCVVIDRQGKVRMIRVGSGEKNAQDIGDLLEQLVADTGVK